MASALTATAIFGGHINMPRLLQNCFETDLEIRNRLGLLGTGPHWITSQLGNYIWGTVCPHGLFSLLFFSQMAAGFAELYYVRHKRHPSGVNNIATPEKHSYTPEMKYGRNNVCVLFSDTTCVPIPRPTLLSDRAHLQHTGSVPGEKESLETKCIEALTFHISQCRTEVVKQQAGNLFCSESFQSKLMFSCQISCFSW